MPTKFRFGFIGTCKSDLDQIKTENVVAAYQEVL